MGGNLDSAVAASRIAVRGVLQPYAQLAFTNPVVVALSGGADSLALAAASAFEAQKLGLQLHCAIVDHQLQANSAAVAARASEQARALGAVAAVLPAQVAAKGTGPEAAARAVRYELLTNYCKEVGAGLLLTAHTRNDQAEQLLLAQVRGSGLKALAGIPARRELAAGITLARPFLGISRAETERACRVQKLDFWADPHNSDPKYLRSRVRTAVLPELEKQLGGAVSKNLARTAQLVAADAAALDEWAKAAYTAAKTPETDGQQVVLAVKSLQQLPEAVAGRVVRLAAAQLGAYYTLAHTEQVLKLVHAWRGQRALNLPGSVVSRKKTKLVFEKF